MVKYSNETANDALMDKPVYIEVGKRRDENATILYWGTYKGITSLGPKQMIILENAEHINGAGIVDNPSESDKSKEETNDESESLDSEGMITSIKSYISLEDIISIDLVEEI